MCTNSILLDYFLDERSTENSRGLTGEYNSTKKCFGDDSNLPWSLDGVQSTGEGVAYWGFFGSVLLIGENFPPLRKNCILLSYGSWGLMLTPPSRGFYQLHWGNLILQLLRGLLLCLGPIEESYWILIGICLIILTHKEVFIMISDSLRDVFYTFDPLGILLTLSIHWKCIWYFQSIRDAFLGSLCSLYT